jgi:hypothetical protein
MANPETQKTAEKPAPLGEQPEKVAVVNLINAAGFDSEATTIIVGRNVDAALETDLGVLVQRRLGTLAEDEAVPDSVGQHPQHRVRPAGGGQVVSATDVVGAERRKIQHHLSEAREFMVKGGRTVPSFLRLVDFLMRRGWSRLAARYRANQMMGGGYL